MVICEWLSGWQVNIHTDTLNEGGFVESMFFLSVYWSVD